MNRNRTFLSRDGTITIELSILFPVFCMIAMTFVFYMHGIVLEIGMGAAAREGGREYSLNHDREKAVERTRCVLEEFMIDRAAVHIHNSGEELGIVVDRPYRLYIPFVGEKNYELRRMLIFRADTLEDR